MRKVYFEDGLRRSDFDNVETIKTPKGRYIVTAACSGAKVNVKFLRSLENYALRNKGKLRVLPMRGHVGALSKQPDYFDPIIEDMVEVGGVWSEIIFNSNLKAVDLQLNPQQALPMNALLEIEGYSILVAHPEVAMKHTATSNNKPPRVVHSTGVCTDPHYLINHQGRKAAYNHKLAAVIVELDGETFHLRQLEALKDGSIIDLGVRYYPNGNIKRVRAVNAKLGDIHAGQHDPAALAFCAEVCAIVHPEAIFIEDLFNGISISHHNSHSMFVNARLPENLDTLKKEMTATRDVFMQLQNMVPDDCQLYVVKSNHDEWIYRYLTECRFAKDPVNFAYAVKLVAHQLDGNDPLATEVDPLGMATWLTRGQDVHMDGIQLGCHGDIAANGAKGSEKGLAKAHRKITHGHTHSSYIYRGVWGTGTFSLLRMGYNQGASNWTQSLTIQYEEGIRQTITLINGSWRLKP